MNEEITYEEALEKLRDAFHLIKSDETIKKIEESKDEVLTRYQQVFSPENIPKLSEHEFLGFLKYENNKHWTGLGRQGAKICADMPLLQKTITNLLDEDKPIEERFNNATKNVKGMGRAITTAILLIVYPDKYGIWNGTSEGGMKLLNLFPKFERKESAGKRYVKVNEILLNLAEQLEVDLWTLDTFWWAIHKSTSDEIEAREEVVPDEMLPESTYAAQTFGLESHLQEFLRDNWDSTSVGQEWDIYSEPGDDEAGYEYPCGVGRIDLLARHKTKPDWLVIELKRNQTGDATVGQVLRYIGWVKKNLAEKGEEVYGLVICRKAEKELQYALSTQPNVDIQVYEVEFRLREAKGIE